jgi:4-aminobutyrate aminotransferase
MAAHVADVWFRVTELEVASGSGCVVTTTDGREYLDFTSGIAVTSTGHCHPHVVEAIQAQAASFIHAQVNVYRHTRLAELAGRLAAVAPPPVDTFFFANSGAEATETAVKLAKQVTGRPHVIVFQGSFHGRTHLAMAMTTSKTVYRAGHAPLPSGVFVAPFARHDDEVADCLEAVRLLLVSQTAPAETAAMLIEPVLGEGGYVPAPTAFLAGLQDLCREHGILFVADEVQSGFGRTGTMFCVEQHGIEPDVVVMAKGLASGFPISAVGASAELMARWPTGSHGGTYGGNPIGCAAAIATLDVLSEPGFLDGVVARGDQLRTGLLALADEDGGITDVRGPGLMVASELGDPARVPLVLQHCLDDGLILMNAGTFGNVIRWMPPLVVGDAEIDQSLATFGKALAATR